LLVRDEAGRVLLFRFVHVRGPLAGQVYWATPGGGVEDDETYEQAAIRELEEETGLVVDDVGAEVWRQDVVFQAPDGEYRLFEERYFTVRAPHDRISRAGWTALEQEVMAEHRWWTVEALERTTEIVFPETLVALLRSSGA
jgi:8-oxo-dGTP pyrophosphatase MutT (NUDIX family)